jgi:GNAT superfamily N-acetyltransferase
VTVRPICPADDEPLRRFYAELSDDSRALRFLGPTPCLGTTLARSFCSADHEHREGFIAVIEDPNARRELIVGHLCVEPGDASTAEIAVAVADVLHRQGIGRRLVEAGVAWARAAGLRQLVATTFVSNGAILQLVRGLGLPVHVDLLGCGTCRMSMDLAAPLPAVA